MLPSCNSICKLLNSYSFLISNKMKLAINNSDSIGALASTLCLIHCLITPFIFVVQSCAASCCASAPSWWVFFDYLFLTISFFAIFKSTKTTQSNFIKIALWSFWVLLLCLILNESIEVLLINKNVLYFVAVSLSSLHIYNLKYCQCSDNKCCVN